MTSKALKIDNNKIVNGVGNGSANKTVIYLFKNLTHMPNIGAIREFTFNANKVFNYLRQAFIKTLIFQYFYLKNYIIIKTDLSNYIIGEKLSELNLNSNTLPNNLNLNNFNFHQ